MREITEEFIPEWVVTQILNNRASVGIGVGLEQLLRSRVRESLQEQWNNVVLPHGVDNRFMGKNGVTRTIGGPGHSQ